MVDKLTPRAKELSDFVKNCSNKYIYIGIMFGGCIYGFVDETTIFIKTHPGINQEELLEFVSIRISDDDDYDKEYDENCIEPSD